MTKPRFPRNAADGRMEGSNPALDEETHAREAAKIPQPLTPEFKNCTFIAYVEGQMYLDTATGEAKLRLAVDKDDAMATYLALWRARGIVFRVTCERISE